MSAQRRAIFMHTTLSTAGIYTISIILIPMWQFWALFLVVSGLKLLFLPA